MNQQIILGKANIHPSGPEQDCLPVTPVPVACFRIRPDPVKNSTVGAKISLCGSLPGTLQVRKMEKAARGCCCLQRGRVQCSVTHREQQSGDTEVDIHKYIY